MSGALLRSGQAQGFQALGADGQPVYSAALPLRESIRLKLGEDAANCLARVQPSENGERFDWYAPFPGDVVPWSSATDAERTSALARLTELNGQLFATARRMEADSGNREKQVFARLLRKAIHFPGSEYVYLVDGKPVLTFWGFAESGTESLDPLRFLRTPVTPTPVAPPVMAAAVPVVVPRSRWRWLWWLLLLPLLLLLVLFLLRACAPQTHLPLGLSDIQLPGMAAIDRWNERRGLPPRPLIDPRTGLPVFGVDGGSVDGGSAGGRNADAGTLAPLPGMATGGDNAGDPNGVPPGADTPGVPPPELPPPTPDAAPNETPPPPMPDASGQPGDSAPPGAPLHIPQQALQDGSTDFLNGRWRADAGLRDTRSNQPIQVDYVFEKGKGEVQILQRHNGVTCRGPATASLQGDQLGIGQGQATCSDGSSYTLPQVRCQPGSGAASCQAIYQDRQFPMSINQQP